MRKEILTKATVGLMTGIIAFSFVGCGVSEQVNAKENVEDVAEADAQEYILGGWATNADELAIDKNAAAKAAFEKAIDGLVGYSYEPIALLGTQVVAGTNYAILVRGCAATLDAVPEIQIVYIYEDLDGNASILSVQEITLNAEEAVNN